MINNPEFNKELRFLINKHSLENGSNSPDWILADYLEGCLLNFNRTLQQRDGFYGEHQLGSETKKVEISHCGNCRYDEICQHKGGGTCCEKWEYWTESGKPK